MSNRADLFVRTNRLVRRNPWLFDGFAEYILLAFMPQSVGLSIHPRFTGVSIGRECNDDPKTCQRAVAEP